MFSKAVSVAAGYTRPVVISHRNAEGKCGSVIGAYIVLNRDGWILTAGHLLGILRQQQESAGRRAGFRENVIEFQRDLAADKRFRKQGVRTFHLPEKSAVSNHSAWWGVDGMGLVEAKIRPSADLALCRLEPFDPDSIPRFPVIKDPARGYSPGRSLCNLGFPLHRIEPRYDEETNSFTLPPGGRAAAHAAAGRDVHAGDQQARARGRRGRKVRLHRAVLAEPHRADGRARLRRRRRGVGHPVPHRALPARVQPADPGRAKGRRGAPVPQYGSRGTRGGHPPVPRR